MESVSEGGEGREGSEVKRGGEGRRGSARVELSRHPFLYHHERFFDIHRSVSPLFKRRRVGLCSRWEIGFSV